MKRLRGFTLLELLIAISIFAMIGLGSYQVLAAVLNAQAVTDAASERLVRMQRTYLRLGQDFRQIIERPIRDEYGESQPALYRPERGYDLEFTRTGWRNPLRRQRSELQRVAFELDGSTLLRHYWTVLDRAQDSEPRTQVVMENLEALEFRLLDENGQWHQTWPPRRRFAGPSAGSEAQEAPSTLPAALEMRITTPEYGELRWLFEVSG